MIVSSKNIFKYLVISLYILALSQYSNANIILSKPNIKNISNYSGDNQFINQNQSKKNIFKVKVTKNGIALNNCILNIKVISSPDTLYKGYIFQNTIITDSKGIAEFKYEPGKVPGEYLILVENKDIKEDSNTLIYKITVRPKYWSVWVIFGLLGGLGLFLFGINYMSDGLQRAAGSKLRTILSKLTNKKLAGLGVGAFITTIIQSSSATSVMLISFIDSGLMKFRQSVPVIIGAAIGTTITVQIVALNINKYGLALVAIGFILNFMANKQQIKHTGQIFTGLGILFLGLLLMSEAISPLKTYQPIIDGLLEMENPIIGVIAGIIFTAITQSASAFIGILVILGQQNLLTLEASIPLLIGANIGTSATPIIASIGHTFDAKKVAVAHTVYRIIGALLIIWWIPTFANIIREISISTKIFGDMSNVPRQIANSHTLFYIVLTLIAIPFSNLFANFIDLIVPKNKEKVSAELYVQYLDENLLSTPSFALNLAKQETIRMAFIADNLVDDIIDGIITKNKESLLKVEKNQKLLSFLHKKTSDYLLKISRQNLHEQNTKEAFQMLSIAKEIGLIGDIVTIGLLPKVRIWVMESNSFSDEGENEIIEYHKLCKKQLNRAIEVFKDSNLEKAKLIKKKDKKYSEIAIELENSHFNRLVCEIEKSIGSSSMHIETISTLNTINRHSTNIARILLKSNI